MDSFITLSLHSPNRNRKPFWRFNYVHPHTWREICHSSNSRVKFQTRIGLKDQPLVTPTCRKEGNVRLCMVSLTWGQTIIIHVKFQLWSVAGQWCCLFCTMFRAEKLWCLGVNHVSEKIKIGTNLLLALPCKAICCPVITECEVYSLSKWHLSIGLSKRQSRKGK